MFLRRLIFILPGKLTESCGKRFVHTRNSPEEGENSAQHINLDNNLLCSCAVSGVARHRQKPQIRDLCVCVPQSPFHVLRLKFLCLYFFHFGKGFWLTCLSCGFVHRRSRRDFIKISREGGSDTIANNRFRFQRRQHWVGWCKSWKIIGPGKFSHLRFNLIEWNGTMVFEVKLIRDYDQLN